MVNRFDPAMPAEAYKTYQAMTPLSALRPASCAAVDCEAHLFGWVTRVDESTDIGRSQATYIRGAAQRKFTEERTGTLTVFTFPAGQKCFAAHQVRDGRPPLFIVRDGDWRGNPRGTQPRYHARPENWVEDFQEHQQTLAQELQRG